MSDGNSVRDILSNPFSKRTRQVQLDIIKNGKPRPPLPNLSSKHKNKSNEYNRYFSISKYDKIEWLTGCEVRSGLFCWPCLLFAKEKSVWNRSGFVDLNHLEAASKKHEGSKSHIRSFMSLKLFENNRMGFVNEALCEENISNHNQLVNKNRQVAKRIIDAIIYLAKQELPFQNRNESDDSINRGNYVEFLDALQEYDTVLNSMHLNTATVFCISPPIENDLVEGIGHVLEDHIKNEVKSAKFVAIILDETSGIIRESQLSTVFRYVSEGEICERFIGFTNLSSDGTADCLLSHIVNIVNEFQIQEKLVGYTYDGASVISGNVNYLQSKVIEAYPLAIFTHSYTHVLNLTLQNGLSDIKECSSFFQTLNGLTAFFSATSKEILALQEFVEKRYPSATPTTWNYTSRLSNTVKQYRCEFVDFFRDILNNFEQWASDTVIKTKGFLIFLENFQTIKLLHIFSKLFEITDVLDNIVQSKSLDTLYCCEKITEILQILRKEQENNGESIWDSYVSEINDGCMLLTNDSVIEEKNAFSLLYNKIIDSICQQIECRFSSIPDLEFFQLLMNEKYEIYNESFPNNLIDKLKNYYGTLFDFPRLKNELIVLYSCPEFSEKSIHVLIKFMKIYNLETSFQEVFKLGNLILTIPSNMVSAEYSLSAINKIKTCYRRMEGPERLSALSLISIEQKLVNELKQKDTFYDQVIEKLLRMRNIKELMYK